MEFRAYAIRATITVGANPWNAFSNISLCGFRLTYGNDESSLFYEFREPDGGVVTQPECARRFRCDCQ